MASLGGDSGGTFQASNLAKWFHSAPHKDFNLDSTTTVFSPSDESYNESLYLLAIFISSFGGLLLIIFVVYYSCCYWTFCKKADRMSAESYQARKSCLQSFIVILAMICCGAVIMGFIFNGRTSDGVDQFCDAVDDVQTNINDASTVGKHAKSRLITAKNNIRILMDVSKLSDATAAFDLCSKVIGYQDYLNGLLPQDVVNDSDDVSDKVHQYENYRWLTTFGVLIWCVLLFVLSFWSGCRTNGCIMTMLTILTLFAVLFTWVLLGIDFGIATGIGDFCVSPAKAIKKIKNGSETSVVIDYYINCSKYNPFTPAFDKLQEFLNLVIEHIQNIQDVVYENLTSEILYDLNYVNNNLSIYEEDFACSKIHKEYMDAMDGLCDKTLNGLALVMLSILIIAFLSGLLTCCVCPLWKYRKSYHLAYPDVDDVHIGDRGEAVLWWPHDLGYEERRNQGQADRSEQTPLIPNEHSPPNYETMDNRHSNLNHIQPNGVEGNERRDVENTPRRQDHLQHSARHYSF